MKTRFKEKMATLSFFAKPIWNSNIFPGENISLSSGNDDDDDDCDDDDDDDDCDDDGNDDKDDDDDASEIYL